MKGKTKHIDKKRGNPHGNNPNQQQRTGGKQNSNDQLRTGVNTGIRDKQ